jgi:hypothetical protein
MVAVRTPATMVPALVESLVPIVAIVMTFGCPVLLVATFKFFKLKQQELELETEFRRSAGAALEQRVQRLESIILALDADLRAKLSAVSPDGVRPSLPPRTDD